MITVIDIPTTVWTQITNIGQSGTCWKKQGGQVIIAHTTAEGNPTVAIGGDNLTIDGSKRLALDQDNIPALAIPADSGTDVYYALAIGKANKIVVDVL